MADIASLSQSPEQSAILYGAAEALRDAIGLPMLPAIRSEHERREREARSALEPGIADRLWSDGRRLALEDALNLATEIVSMPGLSSTVAKKAEITRRELDVLRLLAEGQTDREISAALFISHTTVKWHCRNLFTKFDVTTRTALAAYAAKHQLI